LKLLSFCPARNWIDSGFPYSSKIGEQIYAHPPLKRETKRMGASNINTLYIDLADYNCKFDIHGAPL
jgi:hypothetical protein